MARLVEVVPSIRKREGIPCAQGMPRDAAVSPLPLGGCVCRRESVSKVLSSRGSARRTGGTGSSGKCQPHEGVWDQVASLVRAGALWA